MLSRLGGYAPDHEALLRHLLGTKSEWRRKLKTDLDLDLRFQDTLHTRATRLLRKTGNLQVVQRLAGHADIDTTARFYAHMTLYEVRAALEVDTQSRRRKGA